MLTCRECIEGLEKAAGYFRHLQSVGFFGDQPVFMEHEKYCNDAIAMMKEHLNCSKKSNGSNPPEVVRCKDCEHGYRCKNAAGEDCVECSNHYVSLESICRKPDWFCADGEHKNIRKPVSTSATDYDGINCE